MPGTKLRWARGPRDARLMHWCPGCEEVHGYRVEGEGAPKWRSYTWRPQPLGLDYERP